MQDQVTPSRARAALAAIDGAFAAMALAILGAGAWLILSADSRVWVDLLFDDAYYYLAIARSLVETGQSSYLPPFETNGYQPLWMAVQTLGALVSGASTANLAAAAYLIGGAFVAAFAFASRRIYGAAFPAILSAFALPMVMLQGMETAMLPLFFVLFINAPDWRGRGVFGTLLMLTRLDALSIVIARDIVSFLKTRQVDLRAYIVIAPVAAAYAVFNHLTFGSAVPVSGLAKSVGSAPGENLIWVATSYFEALASLSLLVSLAAVAVLLRGGFLKVRYRFELAVIATAGAICLLYYGVMSGWPVWGWYFWPVLMIHYFLLLEICDLLRSGPDGRARTIGAALVAVSIAVSIWGVVESALEIRRLAAARAEPSGLSATFGRRNVELAEWARNGGAPAQAFFAMGDRAGSFGYFLGQDFRFLHTEGLVASIGYIDALKMDMAETFIDRLDIDFWVSDRERHIETDEVVGVIEPVQALSAHTGPYMVCFRREGVLLDQSWMLGDRRQQRYLFDHAARTACPETLLRQFEDLRIQYAGVHRFSLLP